jgi:hypothetical protein
MLDFVIPASRTELTEANSTTTRVWFRFFEGLYQYTRKGFGSFFDTTTQTVAANTPQAITFNSSGTTESIALDAITSRIAVSRNGTYNVQVSVQVASTGATDSVVVWIKVNGVNLASSLRLIAVPASPAQTVLSFNKFIDLVPRDYIEVFWLSVSGTSQLKFTAASASPLYPATPSVIVTLDQIV